MMGSRSFFVQGGRQPQAAAGVRILACRRPGRETGSMGLPRHAPGLVVILYRAAKLDPSALIHGGLSQKAASMFF
jgi:hypothetical protein